MNNISGFPVKFDPINNTSMQSVYSFDRRYMQGDICELRFVCCCMHAELRLYRTAKEGVANHQTRIYCWPSGL